MIKFRNKGGDFSNTERYLRKTRRLGRKFDEYTLDEIGRLTVSRLKHATPKDTGLTADSWGYEIEQTELGNTITFYNKNVVRSDENGALKNQNGVNIALMLEFGHVTPSGTWVSGRNYIEPTIREVYLNIVNNTWKELVKA